MKKPNAETLITNLNQAIEQAYRDEKQTHAMAEHIQTHINSLHNAINITSKKPDDALMRFVLDYIHSTSQHLQALYTLGSEAGIDEYTEPFLNLACTYMLTPPEILSSLEGLHSMLCRAYLAHRLMEEVNDQIMNLSGAALAPMDMSMANIISHSIIGDELANQLDHLILLSVETADVDHNIFEKRTVSQFLSKRKLKNWQTVLERWPCFTKNCAIDLQIGP